MLPYVKLTLVTLFFASIKVANGLKNEPNWINLLVNYINRDLKIFRSLFIINDTNPNQVIKFTEILRKVELSIPCQLISLGNATVESVRILSPVPLYQDLESTTLIVFIHFLNKKLLERSTEFFIELSATQIRPKCLLIVFSENKKRTYEELLQRMWSKRALDFTILEFTKRVDNNDLKSNYQREGVRIHYLNPFTGIYTKGNYTPVNQIFPNKLKNLNGFEMKVGSIHYPPQVYIKQNLSGHAIKVYGPEGLTVNFLSEAMNFRII